MLEKREGSRTPAVYITDAGFANDLALISNYMEQPSGTSIKIRNGSWMADSKKDMKVRIALAWKALNKLDKIWKSKLKSKLKVQFFRSTVKSVLLYGVES